jgi:hypothetical protein
MSIDPRELKEAALIGLRHERQRIEELIQRLQRELGTGAEASPTVPRKRQMSAEGRKRIIAAVKKRWAAAKAAKAVAEAGRSTPKPTKKAAARKSAAKASVPQPAKKKPVSRVKAASSAKKATAKKRPVPKASSKLAPPPAPAAVEPQTSETAAS